MRSILLVCLFAFAGCSAPATDGEAEPDKPKSRPVPPFVKPVDPVSPCPPDDGGKWPRKPRKPRSPAPVGAAVGGKTSPDGREQLNCDLPGRFHQKNTGGSDGAGLCVYASARHAGRWQDDPVFDAIFDWMKRHPGGSYPQKFDQTIAQCAKELGLAPPVYIQIEENDLELLKKASENGLFIGSTYNYSPTGRYGGQRVSHMVSLPHFSDVWVAVLDNNYIGEDNYEWMSPDEYLKVAAGGRKLWAVILLAKSPPPPPKSKETNP